VGDRYVNIGDVGGIVYDEKTLSQEGACWLFRGNFGFPGARIGGDSIVDVGEATLSATGAPAVDILGSSVVVGGNLRFGVISGAADATVLRPTDFEQGALTYAAGANWETWKLSSPSYLRTKSPIFMGGAGVTLKVNVPGYTVQAYVLDRDGIGIAATALTDTGAGVTLAIPAGQYFLIRLSKKPAAAIAPSDATTAAITYTTLYDGKLVINDSRLEVSPATSTGTMTIRPGGTYAIASGAKYPDSVIQNSKVSITSHATDNRTITLMSEVIDTNAIIDASVISASVIVGVYSNVKNLAFSGSVAGSYDINIRGAIRATDCDNFAVSPTIFPGLAEAQAANMPFIFQGCNVPGGRFYHHAQIANTYKNIDFALAQTDLGKQIVNPNILVSSEVEGMYRLYSTGSSIFGMLVESYDSVRSLNASGGLNNSYGTTIYKDAYLNGLFDLAGTNVFGNKVRSHPLAQVLNVAPRAVQGMFNTAAVGGTITGVAAHANRVCVPIPFRINGAKGLTINCPTGFEGAIICTDINGVIKGLTVLATGESSVPAAQLVNTNAYLFFGKTGGAAITPADLAGVTVTVYNGCKIVNTGETAVLMRGNIRVEDNATLINSSIMGTGYFGGNAIMSGVSISGCTYMKDNASIIRTAPSGPIRDLKMTENAYAVLGDFALNGRIHLSDNSVFTPTAAGLSEGDLVMKDNAVVSGVVTIGGVLIMKDNAKSSAGALSTYGDITLCGSYNQTTSKSWTGKRVIYSETEPEYDNNVKTQYDF
jgi:hypothetical protein